ncbi:MAG TPA: homocysteine S-methyltransferase family protein [Atribacterota bacterium]|nr:homocysteine S-methyltransferase family protein [Atribacterota bacterium]
MEKENKKGMGNDFLALLSQKTLVIDGAMGTMLQQYGLKAGEAPEMWNITQPDIVKSIHTSYLEAGADIILTNTFGANGIKLQKLGFRERLLELNEQAVKLARKAADEYREVHQQPIFIAGSIGPSGEILGPCGLVKDEEAYAGYEEQVKVLASSGIDFILLETFYDLNEIGIALKAVKEICDLPVFASMTFDDSLKTIYGISPEKAVKVLFQEGADGVGANCGSGPETLYKVIAQMRVLTDAPLLVKPNAGIPYIDNNRIIYPATPQEMAEYTEKFIQLRVNIIGGCCGTTPEHIRAIAGKVKKSV